MGGRGPALALGALLLSCSLACGTPIGVKRVDPRSVYRSLTSNVLSTGELSNPTRNVLYRRDLFERYAAHPQEALAELHAAVADGHGGRDEIFALAELSFDHASRMGKQRWFLASMVYAYAFLFPGGEHHEPDPFDPRFRLACDLYNRGITEGFASADGKEVELRAGSYALPFGTLEVAFDAAELDWGSRRLVHLIPVADLDVRGIWARYRFPGIGAPLAANTEPLDPEKGFDDFLAPWAKVPVTAVVRIDDPRGALATGRLNASLHLNASSDRTLLGVDHRSVPLEIESTAALAYMLAESPVWQQEIKGFLQNTGVIDEKSRLVALSPYEPGRVPVVLVHGTASSLGRWAQMLNELANDPRILARYQFWLFSYDTGNPILYSAMLLREALANAVEQLERRGRDSALHHMVVIGHSQGGLLAKLTAIDSGDRFWNGVTRIPLDRLVMPAHSRDLLRRMAYVEPLPFVQRVIFMATPQHGSYFANNVLAHWVARFITLPLDVVRAGTDLVTFNRDAIALTAVGQPATSVDNMRPGSRFIQTLAAIPIAPGIAANSIIAVSGTKPLAEDGDGVVQYASAHLDGTDSELVVTSGHSCQSNPHVIDEVRRILLLDSSDQAAVMERR